MQGRRVTTIPAVRDRFTAQPIHQTQKRRVAAYARVSTDHEEQLTSYEAQVDYYTGYIKSREDWEFVHVYTDVYQRKRNEKQTIKIKATKIYWQI